MSASDCRAIGAVVDTNLNQAALTVPSIADTEVLTRSVTNVGAVTVTGVEVVDPVVTVVSAAVEAAPFDLYRPHLAATLPTQLDHAAVALRHPGRQRVLRIAAAAVAGRRS